MSDWPDRVFIVTDEGGGYHIKSVWTTREQAEAHAPYGAVVEEWLVSETTERRVTEYGVQLSPRGKFFTSGPYTGGVGHTNARWDDRVGVWVGEGYGPTPEDARRALDAAVAKAKAEREGEEQG